MDEQYLSPASYDPLNICTFIVIVPHLDGFTCVAVVMLKLGGRPPHRGVSLTSAFFFSSLAFRFAADTG